MNLVNPFSGSGDLIGQRLLHMMMGVQVFDAAMEAGADDIETVEHREEGEPAFKV